VAGREWADAEELLVARQWHMALASMASWTANRSHPRSPAAIPCRRYTSSVGTSTIAKMTCFSEPGLLASIRTVAIAICVASSTGYRITALNVLRTARFKSLIPSSCFDHPGAHVSYPPSCEIDFWEVADPYPSS
jgi:hypothetical protein